MLSETERKLVTQILGADLSSLERKVNAGEAYRALLGGGFIKECLGPFTSSSVAALVGAVIGNWDLFWRVAQNIGGYTSHNGSAEDRYQWILSTARDWVGNSIFSVVETGYHHR